jgi:hypothetical protein
VATEDGGRSTRPDDQLVARLGRLLLLLAELHDRPIRQPVDTQRLALLDFCADHPHTLYSSDSIPGQELTAAGFSRQTLSYSSLVQRFANRRGTIERDLAHLIARRLIEARAGPIVTFALSESGRQLAGRFESAYADGYRVSARYASAFFKTTGKTKVQETAQRLLAEATLTLDVMPHGNR